MLWIVIFIVQSIIKYSLMKAGLWNDQEPGHMSAVSIELVDSIKKKV